VPAPRRLPSSASPFRYFNSSPDMIRLLMYARFLLSLCNVENLLFERCRHLTRPCTIA
jgi:hypothetical protein